MYSIYVLNLADGKVGVIRPVSEFKGLVEVKTEYIQYLCLTLPIVKEVSSGLS